MLLLVMVSIMGWCTIPPKETEKPHLVYDNRIIKEDIARNQAAAMAKATATYNAWLDQRGEAMSDMTIGFLVGNAFMVLFLVICFLGARACPPDEYDQTRPPRLPR
jgi:hypothetical protein